MATEAPGIDLFNPILQALRDQFERAAFPDGGLDDCDSEIGPLYNEHFKRPYVCVLMADVLSGRWQLGTTQEEISERLGIVNDRTWVSRALHQGRLSLEVFLRLRCCPSRPDDWEPDVTALRGDMERSGFIGVARHLAGRITDRPTLAPQRLDELNYELICEIFARLPSWTPEFLRRNKTLAREMVGDVCLDPRRNVNPRWYASREQKKIAAEIERLTSDGQLALERLGQLQRDWLDVFVASAVVLELVKWNAS